MSIGTPMITLVTKSHDPLTDVSMNGCSCRLVILEPLLVLPPPTIVSTVVLLLKPQSPPSSDTSHLKHTRNPKKPRFEPTDGYCDLQSDSDVPASAGVDAAWL